MVAIFLAIAGGLIVGTALGWLWATRDSDYYLQLAEHKVYKANRQAGKLSKIIHRQRLIIKALRIQVPKISKAAYVQQQPVSH